MYLLDLKWLKISLILSTKSYYITAKNDRSYQMRPFIYDSKFKIEEETSQAIAWISFPNPLPTFFIKETLFTLTYAVGKPLKLDMVTNKTRPSRARVKLQLDLLAERPQFVQIEIEDENTNATRSVKVKIKYDNILSYRRKCKIQGHMEDECRILHPELKKITNNPEEETQQDQQRRMRNEKYVGNRKWIPTTKVIF